LIDEPEVMFRIGWLAYWAYNFASGPTNISEEKAEFIIISNDQICRIKKITLIKQVAR
jgi:hypothetical protein